MTMLGNHTIGGVAVGAEEAGAPTMDISGTILNWRGCQAYFVIAVMNLG
jgi:hypothetical protein